MTQSNQHATQKAPNTSLSEHELTEDDLDRYKTLKQQLHASEKQQAKLLYEIKSEELYLAEYNSFELFCNAEVGYSRRQADRYVNWGRVLSIVGPNGPEKEAHARPLSSIRDEEKVTSIWKRAQQAATARETGVSQPLVREARSKHLAGKCDEDTSANNESSPQNCQTTASTDEDRRKACESTQASGSQAKVSGNDETISSTRATAEEPSNQPVSTKTPEQTKAKGTPKENTQALPGESQIDVCVPESVVRELGLKPLVTRCDARDEYHIPFNQLSDQKLDEALSVVSPQTAPPLTSSTPIADGCFFPLEGSDDPTASLPNPTEELVVPSQLRLQVLAQVQRKVGRDRTCRILLSPQVDLFDPAVPNSFQRHILDACAKVESRVLLFTRSPKNVPGDSVPESVWVGVDATHSDLSGVESAIRNSGLSSCWVRFTADRTNFDTEPLPVSSGSPIDWLVLDGSDQTITKNAYESLLKSASEADATLFFRDPVKFVHRAEPPAVNPDA